MARPSVSSQSIVDLASSKVQSNRARKGFDDDGLLWSSDSDDESAVETNKNKELRNKQEQLKNIELIRSKYTLQNKSLAKNNSLMMLKISEMEAKVSDLINENMILRKRKTFKDNELKKCLQMKLDIVESRLLEKFGEIFEILRDVRMSEGIPENPKLNIFKDLLNDVPPATSTPIEGDSNKADNPFICISRPQPLKEDTFVLPKSHHHLQTIGATLENNAAEKDHIPTVQSTPPSQRTKKDEKDQVHDSKIFSEDSSIPKGKPKVNRMKQEKAESSRHKQSGKQDKTQGDVKLRNKNISVEESKFKVYKDKSQDSEAELVKKATEPKELRASSTVQPHQSSHNDNSTQPSERDGELEINKRPSRNRKPVSYKWPSLSKKMRRESEKFVDAVVLSDDIVASNATEIKQEPLTDNDKKRSSESIENRPIKKSKRLPLGNITAASNENRNIKTSNQGSINKEISKSLNALDVNEKRLEIRSDLGRNDKEDSSIFDFEDENKPTKTYGKRRLSSSKGHI